MISRYVALGIKVADAVKIAGIKRSTYYYKSYGKRKGKQPSMYTLKNGVMVPNEEVLKGILKNIDAEYHDYGYQTLTVLLKREGFLINKKKVYRLMKENHLLNPSVKKGIARKKTFTRYTVPPLEGPFRTIEADIKYVYIHQQDRNALLLSFLCTFCRLAPVWKLQYSIKSKDCANLVEVLINQPEVRKYIEDHQVKILIRTDNGSQFIARALAQTLESLGIAHEFIRPATPQQNAHIESFHSTVTSLVCNKNIFRDLEHAREVFKGFYHAYNETRVMKALLYYPPKKFLELWESGIIGIKKDPKSNKEVFHFKEKPFPPAGIGSSAEDLYRENKCSNFDKSVQNQIQK